MDTAGSWTKADKRGLKENQRNSIIRKHITCTVFTLASRVAAPRDWPVFSVSKLLAQTAN